MGGITQEQIAEKLNISRTTVARALYNKGYVKSELKSQILSMASNYGYKTNQMARNLVRQRDWNILCFLVSYDEDFSRQMESGIRVAEKEFSSWGAKARVFCHSPKNLSQQIVDFEREIQTGEVDAILMAAMDPAAVRAVMTRYGKDNLPLVALNLPMTTGEYLCYVGNNDIHAGTICADMMAKLLGNQGTVLYINNFGTHVALDNRFSGFFQKIKAFPHIQTIVENGWQDMAAFYENTLAALQRYPELSGIYSNTSIEGIDRALRKAGRQDIKLIGNDWSVKYRDYFLDDTIDCIVCQRPTLQGYLGLKYLLKYLISNDMPETTSICVGFDIVTAANLDTEDYFKLLY